MSAATLYTVRYTLSKNGGVVHVLTGGARGPQGADASVASATHAATDKATPVDADEMPLSDSAASWGLKKLTWANLKATLKTYFDTLYQPLAAALTSWAGVTRAAGFDTFAATPSSANLRSLLTDETGTGSAVFADSPTFTTLINTPKVQSSASVNLQLNAGNGASVHLQANSVTKWAMQGLTYWFGPMDSNSYDLGTSTTTVRTGYFGTSIQVPQIKFPATQSASSDANTLDDYEETTFTPVITIGNLPSTGMTYSIQQGEAVKKGREASASITVAISAIGSGTGSVRIGGLPFAAGSTANRYHAVAVYAQSLTGISGGLQAYLAPSGTELLLRFTGTGGGTDLQHTNLTASSFFVISITYFV